MIIDKSGRKWYKVGLHIHTSISDGRLSPEEAAKLYRENGFDAIAITDHWKFGEEKTLEGLHILSGVEYNVGGVETENFVMHIVGVGMKNAPDLTTSSDAQEIVDKINECGGIAILAHPAWSLNRPSDIEKIHGFSAVEIYNSVSDAGESFRPYSGITIDLLANDGYVLPLVATDDTHYYMGEDDCKSYIMVNAESDSTEDILKAIKEEKFYATQGPELHVRREGDKIVVDCSECVKILFASNGAWAANRTQKGKLTHAEYEIKPFDKWIRVEAFGEDGKCAWSNIIQIER